MWPRFLLGSLDLIFFSMSQKNAICIFLTKLHAIFEFKDILFDTEIYDLTELSWTTRTIHFQSSMTNFKVICSVLRSEAREMWLHELENINWSKINFKVCQLNTWIQYKLWQGYHAWILSTDFLSYHLRENRKRFQLAVIENCFRPHSDARRTASETPDSPFKCLISYNDLFT